MIEVVRTWRKATDIIVVDDGSTDKTAAAIGRFSSPKIKIVSLKKNHGKGFAIASGIKLSKGSILLFLDADILGLTHFDLDDLVKPVLQNTADMTLGIQNFLSIGSVHPFNHLTGQRALLKKYIVQYLSQLERTGGGAEILINSLFKQKRIVSIVQPHVYSLRKLDKWNFPYSWFSYVKQAWHLFRTRLTLP